MKFSITVLLTFLCLSINAQNIDKLDTKNGFKGFIIGDSLSKFKGIVKYNSRYGLYIVTGGKMHIDGYQVDKVALTFFDDLLFSINVYISGDEAVNHIHEALKNAYGDGNEIINEEHLRYVKWSGKRIELVFTKDIVAGSLFGVLTFTKTSNLQIPKNDNASSNSDL